MSSQAVLRTLKKLEHVLSGGGGDGCPLLSFIRNRDRYLVWKDVPHHIRQSIKEHRTALINIHLKPGEWKPGAYENLSEEEREILEKAFEIMERLEIKEGEELEPEKIH